jgi:hypothetical protein
LPSIPRRLIKTQTCSTQAKHVSLVGSEKGFPILQHPNTLSFLSSFAHRPFTTQSCSHRILFSVGRECREYFYSAKIQKDGALGPATMLPPIPSKELLGFDLSWSKSSEVLGGKIFLRSDGQIHIYSPDTGEYSTLPHVPPLAFPVKFPIRDYKNYYFGFDTLSNEQKVLVVQSVWLSRTLLNRFFWVFTRGSGSWSQMQPFPKFDFPLDFRKVVFANGAIHCICDGDAHFSSRRCPSEQWRTQACKNGGAKSKIFF